ncbi:hypothetical protein C1H76_7448 [Elsinoe australis]|uniref:Uncharacterized protein n=1 Tax=Elsinoe australis TaxID=40998 RepID=A0A4V6DTQ6_9PEZI|nr:hypothetical protein C1H76_7448 [Elsinoe australis]
MLLVAHVSSFFIANISALTQRTPSLFRTVASDSSALSAPSTFLPHYSIRLLPRLLGPALQDASRGPARPTSAFDLSVTALRKPRSFAAKLDDILYARSDQTDHKGWGRVPMVKQDGTGKGEAEDEGTVGEEIGGDVGAEDVGGGEEGGGKRRVEDDTHEGTKDLGGRKGNAGDEGAVRDFSDGKVDGGDVGGAESNSRGMGGEDMGPGTWAKGT